MMNKSELSEKLYGMELLDYLGIKHLNQLPDVPGLASVDIKVPIGIIRVPGGWVFSGSVGGVFVPFDNEFMVRKPAARKPSKKTSKK